MTDDLTFTIDCATGAQGTPCFTQTTDSKGNIIGNDTRFFTANNGFGLTVWLYEDVAFDTYRTTYFNQATATTQQQVFAEDYSSYTMMWDCDITILISDPTYYCNQAGTTDLFASVCPNNAVVALTADEKTGSGCCLRDLEDTDGGGYCLIMDSLDPNNPKTYRLTEDNFESLTATTSVVFTDEMLQSIDTTTAGFTAFNCENADADTFTNCRKLQYWPAASWANGFRFQKGDKVMGYVLDNNVANTDVSTKWMDEEQVLLNATSLFMASSVAIVSGLSMLM